MRGIAVAAVVRARGLEAVAVDALVGGAELRGGHGEGVCGARGWAGGGQAGVERAVPGGGLGGVVAGGRGAGVRDAVTRKRGRGGVGGWLRAGGVVACI